MFQMFTRKKTKTASNMSDDDENDDYGGLLPKVAHHSYVLDKDPFAFGGFSNVYFAKKKKKFGNTSIGKGRWYKVKTLRLSSPNSVSHNTYVVKVCETDKERLQEEKHQAVDAYLKNNNDKKALEILKNPVYNNQTQMLTIEAILPEVTIMKALQPSKYVVKFYEAFVLTPTKQVFIVMEKLSVNLSDLCELNLFDQPGNETARRCILNQVVDALCFLKEKEVIHRDIKPSNILISFTGYVKLCDFGLARMNESSYIVDTILGSREFMAPELFIIGHEVDFAIDVWAFGVLVVATYNRGKTMYRPGGHFRDGRWRSWAEGTTAYYYSMLGPRYISEEENNAWIVELSKKIADDIERQSYIEQMKHEKQFIESYEKNYDRVQLLRQCLIPLPIHGPKGDIDRPGLDGLNRVTIEEVRQTQFYKKYDTNKIGELNARNSINKIVAECTLVKNQNGEKYIEITL